MMCSAPLTVVPSQTPARDSRLIYPAPSSPKAVPRNTSLNMYTYTYLCHSSPASRVVSCPVQHSAYLSLATRPTLSRSKAQCRPTFPEGERCADRPGPAPALPRLPHAACLPQHWGPSGHLFPEVTANTFSQLQSQPVRRYTRDCCLI